MALAETTVVETVSGGWPQALSEAERLLQASQLTARTRAERLRRPEARDDGESDCRAGRDLMVTCHGVRMARVASNTRGLSREPLVGLVGPIQDFANRTSPREHE